MTPEREHALDRVARAAELVVKDIVKANVTVDGFRYAYGTAFQDLAREVSALAAFDAAAPDDEEAGREERTEAQRFADDLAYDLKNVLIGANRATLDTPVVVTMLAALRDDLRAIAAAVKEGR